LIAEGHAAKVLNLRSTLLTLAGDDAMPNLSHIYHAGMVRLSAATWAALGHHHQFHQGR
jgi:hypothetical protein